MSLNLPPDLFPKAFSASPVSLALCTWGENRFVEVNDCFLRVLELARHEVVGRTLAELGLWPDPQERDRWLGLLAQKRPVREVECVFRARSGDLRQTLLSAEYLEHDDQCYVLLSNYDVTQRLNQEIRLRQSKKMEAVGQLAAGFAHDFNNILAIVQGYTSLVLAEPNLPQQSAKALKEVSTAAERAANLTRQLLAFSRKQLMQPKTVDLNLVLHGLASMLQRLLKENTVLKFNLSPQVPLVHADTGMMEQVLVNLAVNASDAMPRGGQLLLTTSLVEIDAQHLRQNPEARAGRFARMAISDNGCWMDSATLSRIFEPFFTTKDVGKGPGLGLATVYGIVKQHNGWIEVVSQPGEGTTFNILLPESTKISEPASPTPPSAVRGGKEMILLVEDEPGLRVLVQGILQRYGYGVLNASNGIEALEVWEQHKHEVDLLLTDMVMPEGMSGRQLADKIWEESPLLKVIFTSGYSADLIGDKTGELKEGLNFLQKPYRPQNLAQTVRNCLDSIKPAPVQTLWEGAAKS